MLSTAFGKQHLGDAQHCIYRDLSVGRAVVAGAVSSWWDSMPIIYHMDINLVYDAA